MKQPLLKDFYKLKQSDRIEYMLRLDRIEKKYVYGCSFYFLLRFFMIVLGFFVLLMITGYSAFGIDFSMRIMKFFGFVFVASIIIDIAIVIKGSQARKELYNKFFKVEPKNRGELKFLMRKKK